MKKTMLLMMSVFALNVACSSETKEKESSEEIAKNGPQIEEKESNNKAESNVQMEVYANGDIEIWNSTDAGNLNLTLHIVKGELRWQKNITLSGTNKTNVSWIKDFEVEGPISENETGIVMMNLYVDNEAGNMVASKDAYLSRLGHSELISEAYDYQDFGPPRLKGKLEQSMYWNDRTGHHFVVKSRVEDESGIFLNHFILDTEGYLELDDWKEHEIECEFDLVEYHVSESELEDADADGVKEFYCILVSDCTSDVSPNKAYMYIIEGSALYQLAGTTMVYGEAGGLQGDDNLVKETKVYHRAIDLWHFMQPSTEDH